jgi:hypothetical protein
MIGDRGFDNVVFVFLIKFRVLSLVTLYKNLMDESFNGRLSMTTL